MSWQGPDFNDISELDPADQAFYRSHFMKQHIFEIAEQATVEELKFRRESCRHALDSGEFEWSENERIDFQKMFEFWDGILTKRKTSKEIISGVVASANRLLTETVDKSVVVAFLAETDQPMWEWIVEHSTREQLSQSAAFLADLVLEKDETARLSMSEYSQVCRAYMYWDDVLKKIVEREALENDAVYVYHEHRLPEQPAQMVAVELRQKHSLHPTILPNDPVPGPRLTG